jgi:excinuclease ABC subunit A
MPIFAPVNAANDCIRVRGARVHNLQRIDVDIPRGKLVVVTGVSGSGKSSLAFDTLFAEGQRRYLETLSAQTRAYLDQMQRPEVDEIEGLPPVLSIEQRVGGVQPRSTLATTTGIHDSLRLLYARAGTAHCPNCGRQLSQQSTQAIVDGILALDAGCRAMLLAPLVRGKKGMHRELFEKICREGFVRARVDGTIVDASAPSELKKSKAHDIDVIVDRIVVKEGLRARLFESVEQALRHGKGTCIVSHEEGGQWRDRLFSCCFACPDCELSFPEIEPRTFSFNSPYGACPKCQGLGVISRDDGPLLEGEFCPDCRGARLAPIGRAVTFAGFPIHELLALGVADAEQAIRHLLNAFGRAGDFAFRIPHSELPSGPALVVAERLLPEVHRRLQYLRKVGLDYLSLDRPTQSLSGGEFQRARLAGCLGAGLIGVCYILDEPTVGLHPRDTRRLLETLHELCDQGNSLVVVEHDLDVMREADHLIDLGPGAGREGGRVVAGGAPDQVMYAADSSTGRYLRMVTDRASTSGHGDKGTRRIVELPHSLIVEGANAHNLKDLTVPFPLGVLTCVTGVSGSGKSTLVMETLVPLVRGALASRLQPAGGRRDNRIPSPSMGEGQGGGAEPADARPPTPAVPHEGGGRRSAPQSPRMRGIERIDRLVEIDQSPLGRNARSNPATASGMWDAIRRIFARTREARLHGFRASRFSFNAAGGRCEECRGQGLRRLAMQFLPDMDIVCPACRGDRFNRQTLQVKFRGKSVADVLEMRIDEAAAFFENFADLAATLETFKDVGLGYLALGQSAATLSGGEAQRIRLASELSRHQLPHRMPSQMNPKPAVSSTDPPWPPFTKGGNAEGIGTDPKSEIRNPKSQIHRTLYVLDEPTTGLHPADVERLLDLLQRLVDAGHSVVVIEHQLDVIARADWVIDLGPEGGAEGGEIVAAGTPEQIASVSTSHTGEALRRRRAGFQRNAVIPVRRDDYNKQTLP